MKNLIRILLLTLTIMSCQKDFVNSDVDVKIAAPSEVSAAFKITNDNSGLVNIVPESNGGLKHVVSYNDGSSESDTLDLGQSIDHTFAEGNYEIAVKALGYNNLTSSNEVPLVVSFRAPENLEVTITNDSAISRQVNVVATADYATNYSVYFGADSEAVTANAGETVSYIFPEAGTTTIRVVANSGGSATTVYEDTAFNVTAILQPISSAPRQQARAASDYISIFSDTYTNEAGVDTFPDWGQGGQGSSWTTFDFAGDSMLQYINLSYQGITFSASDVSQMEYLHFDVWTAEVNRIETSLISVGTGEKPVWTVLESDEWTSIDIPISAFTDQGLSVNDIHQLKFVGDVFAAGTVFIDNIYFYRAATGVVTDDIEDFEGTAPVIGTFGNAAVAVINNPDATGINTSAKVAEFTKPAGAEVWAGSNIVLDAPLDIVNFSKISLKTWSPKVGAVVKMKLENADASITHEVDINTSVANTWEQLSYDFSAAPAADYVNLVVFLDFGNAGDGSVYYYDDFKLVDDSGSSLSSPIQSFDGDTPTLTPFGNAAIAIISNPDSSGENTTANVAQFTKPAGAEVWAGVTLDTEVLDLTNYSKISFKSWSPTAGATVLVKLENADASVFHEVSMNTTVANAWETLVYDFSGAAAADYVKVIVFYDFGNTGDGSVYYYDEIKLTN
ncbi:PKD domain protein [Flavobacteriaceae bacterium]|nr:PKD domain protein [Flavobacteriaceae bacterium]